MYSKILIFCVLSLAQTVSLAKLEPISDRELSSVGAQAGITIDAKIKTSTFNNDMRFILADKSYATFSRLQMADTVLDMEVTGLRLDFEGGFANIGGSLKPAIVLGLPDRVKFNNFESTTKYDAVGGDGTLQPITIYEDIIIRAGVERDVGSGQPNYPSAPDAMRFLKYNLSKTSGNGRFIAQNVRFYAFSRDQSSTSAKGAPLIKDISIADDLFTYRIDYNNAGNDQTLPDRDGQKRDGYSEIRFRPTGPGPVTFRFEGDVGRICATTQTDQHHCGDRSAFFNRLGLANAPDVKLAFFNAFEFECGENLDGGDGTGCASHRAGDDAQSPGTRTGGLFSRVDEAEYDRKRIVTQTITPNAITLTPDNLEFTINKIQLQGGFSIGGKVAIFSK